jgi:hypothetical protein
MFKILSIITLIFISFAQTDSMGEEVVQQGFDRHAMNGVQVPLWHCQRAQEKGLFLGTEKKDRETAHGKGSFYSWVYHLYDNKLYATSHHYYVLAKQKTRSDVFCVFHYEDLRYRQ